MSTNRPYLRGAAARTVVSNFGGRVADLPGYMLDGLVSALEHDRHMRRTYDRAYDRARRRGTLGRAALEVQR